MSKTKEVTITVSERAIVQRINRKLRERGEVLKASRGESMAIEVGRYYVLDTDRNVIPLHHVNLLALARKLGAIQPWESLANGAVKQ